jgi:dipeptidyl aminopeptidase/acylaminoacyl peptidase
LNDARSLIRCTAGGLGNGNFRGSLRKPWLRGAVFAGTTIAAIAWCSRSDAQGVPKGVRAEGVPPIPRTLFSSIRPYQFVANSSVNFQGWLTGGRQVLYLSRAGSGLQVFLSDVPGKHRQLTAVNGSVAWALPDPFSQRFAFAHDDGGNERYLFHLYDVATGKSRPFTSGQSYDTNPRWSRDGRLLAFSSNARNGEDRDLSVISPPELATGRRVREADGFCRAEDWSPDGSRIVAIEHGKRPPGSAVLLIDVISGRIEELPPARDAAFRYRIRWSRDGQSLYWLTDRGSDFAHLSSYQIATGKEVAHTYTIHRDIESYDISDDGQTIALVANEDGWSRIHIIDAASGREQPPPRLSRGVIDRISFRPGSHELAFSWCCPRSPFGVYSYDLTSGKATEWVTPTPTSSRTATIPDPRLIRYLSFDGMRIPAIVRHPSAEFVGPRPVLIVIHGGPSDQARPDCSPFWNYITCEQGIAVIEPNVRGSTGFGATYTALDDGRRREDAVRDIGSLIDWIGRQPDLDGTRVAVAGGSYGGYLALAALIRYGDRLRAGLDLAGITDFVSCLRGTRAADLAAARLEFGDERDPGTSEFLREISPLTHASEIRKPVMVIHGENDPRVPVDQSDQIVSSLRRNGVPVWFIRLGGQGHSALAPDHDVFVKLAEILFLRRYLLGVEEPAGRAPSQLKPAGSP